MRKEVIIYIKNHEQQLKNGKGSIRGWWEKEGWKYSTSLGLQERGGINCSS